MLYCPNISQKFLFTAAGEDADLSAFKGHDLHVVQSNATLTFEHTYTWWGNKRKLRVLAEPNVTLSWKHVPPHCRRARTVLLGPLMPQDIDCQSFVHKSRGTLSGTAEAAALIDGYAHFLCPKNPPEALSWVCTNKGHIFQCMHVHPPFYTLSVLCIEIRRPLPCNLGLIGRRHDLQYLTPPDPLAKPHVCNFFPLLAISEWKLIRLRFRFLTGWIDSWLGLHQHIGLMAQGLQRGLDATKKVVPSKEPSKLLTVSSACPNLEERM